MNFRLRIAFAATVIFIPGRALAAEGPALVPEPANVELRSGTFTVSNGMGIRARGRDALNAARLLSEYVAIDRGLSLPLSDRGAIRIEREGSIKGDEAYRLTVDAKGIMITASTEAGLIYGAMTLAQLLSPDALFGRPVSIPALSIDDAPRFRWRGYMADVARHFQPIEALKKTVDQMAMLKLNVLHLHLTDDQGWRVEIKRYPELTRIGAWRMEPSAGGGAPPRRYGGFYTQAQLKDLVAYAAQRGITVVPEIDLPGHAQAIVASYPEFGVFGDRPEVSGDWGINPYLLDPGPKGIEFVKNVLDEIMAIFPGPYIHLGGDEAIKDQWERSPRVQALMKQQGIKSENAVQSYLVHQFADYVRAHGRRRSAGTRSSKAADCRNRRSSCPGRARRARSRRQTKVMTWCFRRRPPCTSTTSSRGSPTSRRRVPPILRSRSKPCTNMMPCRRKLRWRTGRTSLARR